MKRSIDYSQALGNSGAKYELTANGRAWIFSFPCDRQRAWYEQWMKQSELESIDTDDTVNETQKDRMRQRIIRDVKNGVYRYGGPIYNETVQTERGALKYCQMLLIDEQPETTEKEVFDLMNSDRGKVAAIMALIHADSCMDIQGIRGEQREFKLQEIYKKLCLSPEHGGLGLSMDTIAELTDKQKATLLTEDKRDIEKKPEAMYTADERKVIDERLKQLALSQGVQ